LQTKKQEIVHKLKNEKTSFRHQNDTGAAMDKCLQEKGRFARMRRETAQKKSIEKLQN
jgi:hypothetical protein